MNDDERKLELDRRLDKIIKELLIAPIENDRFSATFTKNSFYSGEAIFQDKHSDKVKTAEWITSKTTETILVTLINTNGFLIFEEEYDKFRGKVYRSIVM